MHKLDTDNWLHSWVPGRAPKEEQLVARRGVLVAKGYRATVNVQPCLTWARVNYNFSSGSIPSPHLGKFKM